MITNAILSLKTAVFLLMVTNMAMQEVQSMAEKVKF